MVSTSSYSGIWPAIVTPFKSDNTIDWDTLDIMLEWYIESGIGGIFAVGQSAEMFALTHEERLNLARHIVKFVDGRIPIVATGSFGDTPDEKVEFIKQMSDTGVQAVTLVLASLAHISESTDDILKKRLSYIMDATGDIALSLYECPEPYHRLISPELLQWAAETGRFKLLKETSRSLSAVKAKADVIKNTGMTCLNADATTLLESLKQGALGYCGIAANFYPKILVWIFNNYKSQPEKTVELQTLITTFDPIIHQSYPVSAKYVLKCRDMNILPLSRLRTAPLTDYEHRVLDNMLELAEQAI